jgi:bifunctional NMN adenylyltransferase/nudix hydrolase
MHKPYDTLIYIGRFQPFHNAHLATIKHAATIAQRVIVVVGSANQPRDGDNPFTQQERIMTIEQAISAEGVDAEVKFVSVENQIYNNMAWSVSVADAVEPLVVDHTKTKLIGHTKDESSLYLKMFPQWGTPLEMPLIEVLDATTIRQLYFSDKYNPNFLKNVVPRATMHFLESFRVTTHYDYVMAEVEYIKNYKKPYENLPYPVSFNTGDAVVFKNGHVLMITRRAEPGKGLLAFPGGFLNANSDASLLDCAIRELYEETKIKVPEPVIRGSIVEEKIFGALGRSRRGRIITTAQHIILSDDFPGLPKVRGSDDAVKAAWYPIHKLRRQDCFEDHYDIFSWFKNRV